MIPAAVAVGWRRRESPLLAAGAIAVGAAARRLGIRLLAGGNVELQRLRAVAGADLLCVLGDAEDLPWVDGIEYLGRDPSAPHLWLPTVVAPEVQLELFERAVLAFARSVGAELPLAVGHRPPRAVSVREARPIARSALQSWLEGE